MFGAQRWAAPSGSTQLRTSSVYRSAGLAGLQPQDAQRPSQVVLSVAPCVQLTSICFLDCGWLSDFAYKRGGGVFWL